MPGWVLLPGFFVFVAGQLWKLIAFRSPRQQITALRLRTVGIALFFFGGGLGMVVSGIVALFDPTPIFIGLVLLGMGAFSVYGKRGFGPWWPVA